MPWGIILRVTKLAEHLHYSESSTSLQVCESVLDIRAQQLSVLSRDEQAQMVEG